MLALNQAPPRRRLLVQHRVVGAALQVAEYLSTAGEERMGWAEDLIGELVGKDSAGLEARLQQRAAQETWSQMLSGPPGHVPARCVGV